MLFSTLCARRKITHWSQESKYLWTTPCKAAYSIVGVDSWGVLKSCKEFGGGAQGELKFHRSNIRRCCEGPLSCISLHRKAADVDCEILRGISSNISLHITHPLEIFKILLFPDQRIPMWDKTGEMVHYQKKIPAGWRPNRLLNGAAFGQNINQPYLRLNHKSISYQTHEQN